MAGGYVTGYTQRVQSTLREAFSDDLPPHSVALSFSLGMFAIALPNFGAAVFALVWVGRRFAWASNIAFFAAVAILNPIVKGGVYSLSFAIGVFLLGPAPGISSFELGLDTGTAVLVRVFLGNLILAAGIGLLSYGVAYRVARSVRQH
ncbi:hypothetical protein SAMN05216226_11248 [Halovenus aranensis]|jgi:uncharacterized protein (DUF2062 family)|uniref:DUF2062 domain-containing protein n=1 Tax=Halovenus aranensis TaxID=890420 RepID=A0A1G8XTW6_9EURY|nr:DUF2062 domain-containing protein [Halovenus aranensis]SDJ93345.1 hypothetical protein SAMN05216226_11248 [Halovenus aranensis]